MNHACFSVVNIKINNFVRGQIKRTICVVNFGFCATSENIYAIGKVTPLMKDINKFVEKNNIQV